MGKRSGVQPPKLTDVERHERFKEMAREVEASERPEDFEGAFDRVTADRASPLIVSHHVV